MGPPEHVCLCYLAEFWQAYVHARPEASAQVGGTCEDVAQTLIPHEFPASLMDQMLHLWNEKEHEAMQKHSNLFFN